MYRKTKYVMVLGGLGKDFNRFSGLLDTQRRAGNQSHDFGGVGVGVRVGWE